MHAALAWTGDSVQILDQTRLPHEEVTLTLTTADEVADAIRRLAVRGAPLIGIAAAYGVALAVRAATAGDGASAGLGDDGGGTENGATAAAGRRGGATVPTGQASATEGGEPWADEVARLRAARPTAVNLAWAVDRVVAAVRAGGDALTEADAIRREDEAASAALGRHGADALERALPAGAVTVMTHCNAGGLAASGEGTALAVICELARRRPVHVLTCEARPLLQGARLTAWELGRHGIPHDLIVDSAAAGLIQRGEVHAVVTGFDRVAANGDVCNKVGTYGLALAADAARVPFVAAGPVSSVDPDTPTGADIEIEERDADEVRRDWTLPSTPVRNPAFDVTPAALVWALVTEEGIRECGPRGR